MSLTARHDVHDKSLRATRRPGRNASDYSRSQAKVTVTRWRSRTSLIGRNQQSTGKSGATRICGDILRGGWKRPQYLRKQWAETMGHGRRSLTSSQALPQESRSPEQVTIPGWLMAKTVKNSKTKTICQPCARVNQHSRSLSSPRRQEQQRKAQGYERDTAE